jgi:uncharacterized delta-60 repeat protein
MVRVENLESRVLFAIGSLDHAFGTGGQIFSPAGDTNTSIIVQKNGEFIVEGSTSSSHFLERYRRNGSLDPAFGTGGRIDLNLTQFPSIASVALAPNGEIIVVASDPGRTNPGAVARFTRNGQLDTKFGTSGFASLPASTINARAKVAPDGSVVVLADDDLEPPGQFVTDFLDANAEIFRFNSAGVPDSHFGANGVVTPDLATGHAVGDFEILRGGKIEALFYTVTDALAEAITTLERFNADGTLDSTFDQSMGSAISEFNNNRFLSDGSILSVDDSFSSGSVTVTRYTVAGQPNVAFGAHGTATLAFGVEGAASAIIEPGYKVLIIQSGVQSGLAYTAFGGLTAAGHPDKRFGHKGILQIAPGLAVNATAGDGSRLLVLTNSPTDSSAQIIDAIKVAV